MISPHPRSLHSSFFHFLFYSYYFQLTLLYAMLTIAFVFLSLHLLAVATPVDRGHKDENRIWLTKRSPPSIPVGIPIFTPVTSLLSLLFTQE